MFLPENVLRVFINKKKKKNQHSLNITRESMQCSESQLFVRNHLQEGGLPAYENSMTRGIMIHLNNKYLISSLFNIKYSSSGVQNFTSFNNLFARA